MISVNHRLPRSISKLDGRVLHGNNITLIYRPNNLKHHRLRIIISKRISPLAVSRNKLKRQIAHLTKTYFKGTPPHDLVIIPKTSALNLGYPLLKTELDQLLGQIIDLPSN